MRECVEALRVPSIVVDLEVAAFREVFHIAGGAGDKLLAAMLVDEALSVVRLDGVATGTVEHPLFQKNVVLNFQLVAHGELPI